MKQPSSQANSFRRSEMSREEIMSMRRESWSHVDSAAGKLRPNLSFSGCGFNGIYHIGVAAALQDFAPHLYEDNIISGTSAGSIAAACLKCDLSMKKCAETVLDLIASCKKEGMLFSNFNLNSNIQSSLRNLLPENAHELCSGQLNISMTKLNMGKLGYTLENHVVNQFADNEELITAVMCSSFIPIVSGFYFPTFNGMSVMDGGFTNNMIEINDATITITPFVAEADICPIDSTAHQCFFDLYNTKVKLSFFNFERLANLIFPHSAERMAKILNLGYDDCIRYLLLRKFILCGEHASTFVATGENLSDSCSDCQQLAQRASFSSIPSYLEEMIYEKEPDSHSYWGSVLDNRFAATLIHLNEVCTTLDEINFSEICKSMKILQCLKMFPFIRIALKPVEWYFWVLRTIWNAFRNRGRRETKRPKRHPRRLVEKTTEKKTSDTSPTSELPADGNVPLFYVPEASVDMPAPPSDLEVPNVSELESLIVNTLENISTPIPRDSGIEISDALDNENVDFEQTGVAQVLTDLNSGVSFPSETSTVFIDDGVETDMSSDSESAISVDL